MIDRTLSSTAQRAYWLGRYLERTGSTARLVSVNANLLIDLPVRLPLGWLPLVDILGQDEEFHALYGDANASTGRHLDANEKNVVRFLLSDQRNPGSLLSSLSFARENARTLRGTLPRASYELINDAFLLARDALAEPLSRSRRSQGLSQLTARVDQINGFLSSTMLHDACWQFYRLGNFMERADMTTRTIDLRTANLLENDSALAPFTDIQWRSVLNSLDAMHSYTISMQNPISQPDVLAFLLQSEALPRSLLRCLNTVRNCLRALPRNAAPLDLINQMRRQLQRARVRNLEHDRLHRFVDARQRQLAALHNEITQSYFPDNYG